VPKFRAELPQQSVADIGELVLTPTNQNLKSFQTTLDKCHFATGGRFSVALSRVPLAFCAALIRARARAVCFFPHIGLSLPILRSLISFRVEAE
jgi:hypothetical protein